MFGLGTFLSAIKRAMVEKNYFIDLQQRAVQRKSFFSTLQTDKRNRKFIGVKYRIDMKPYVTIVVPFWNAATTLSNCIDSVLNQTRNDWELILVDDGSVDDGYKICAQYAEKDNRIRLLCRDHEGVGAARNAAMDETQGKFICFVDADDFVDAQLFGKTLFLSGCRPCSLRIYGR